MSVYSRKFHKTVTVNNGTEMPIRSEKITSFLERNIMGIKSEQLPELCHASRKRDLEIENYLCKLSDCSKTRRKHSGRKYCSFCGKIHGNLTAEEGFEKLYQVKPLSKRGVMKELLRHENLPRKNVKKSEESSQSKCSSLSSSLISVAGEKMYEMPKHMAREKASREKGLPVLAGSKSSFSSHEYKHHGDDYDRLVIKVVMPKMSFGVL